MHIMTKKRQRTNFILPHFFSAIQFSILLSVNYENYLVQEFKMMNFNPS